MARSIYIPGNWAVRIPGYESAVSGVYINAPSAESHYQAAQEVFNAGIIANIPFSALLGFSGSPGSNPSGLTADQIKGTLTPEQVDEVGASAGGTNIGAGDDADLTNDENQVVPLLEESRTFQPGDLTPQLGGSETGAAGEEGGASIAGLFDNIGEGSAAADAGVAVTPQQPTGTVTSSAQILEMFPGAQLSSRQIALIDGILQGQFTPDQLAEALADPEFQIIFENEVLGPLLNPALELAVNNATEQLRVAAGVTEAELQSGAQATAGDAAATNAGALLRSGATIDQIMDSIQVGATGLTGNENVLDSQRIAASGGFTSVEDMLEQQRIAASGGLSSAADVLRVQEAQAANNAFGSLQLGGENRLSDILNIIEAQQAGQSGANRIAEQANILNFIGNPAALGAATAAGFDIEGMRAALQREADTPAGAVSVESAMQALEAQDPNSGLGETGLGATRDIGSLRGLNQNFTEGQFVNRSNAEQSQIEGQLAASQGIGRDEIQERARSFTPGDRPTSATRFV
jgi:hypothetical protein